MLILASASPARLDTLRRAGVEPRVEVSNVDEAAVLHDLFQEAAERSQPEPTVITQVLALAKEKAVDIADQFLNEVREGARPGDLILGCDSMFVFDGQVHGKPGSPAAAKQRILQMRGKSGVLYTGHHLLRLPWQEEEITQVSSVSRAVVNFANMTEAEIDRYVATGEPARVAGSFTIDGYGGAFISSIEGDPHGIVGVSLPMLRNMTVELGVQWTDLWSI